MDDDINLEPIIWGSAVCIAIVIAIAWIFAYNDRPLAIYREQTRASVYEVSPTAAKAQKQRLFRLCRQHAEATDPLVKSALEAELENNQLTLKDCPQ